MVQACCAALHMFAESRDAPAHARPFIERAQAGAGARRASSASSRPSRPGSTATSRRAIALHEEQARDIRATWPRSSSVSTTCSTAATRRTCCAWPCLRCRRGRRRLPARHAGLRLGTVPFPGGSRGQRAPSDRHAAQGALGPPRARARDADAGPLVRRPCLPAGRERHLDRPQLLHGHAQLVAPGALCPGAGPGRRSARPLRPPRVGRGQGVQPGPDQCGVAARAGGARRCGRGDRWQDLAHTWRSAATTTCCPSSTCSISTAWRGPRRAGGARLAAQHRTACLRAAAGPRPPCGNASACPRRAACSRMPRATRRRAVEALGQALPRLVEIGGSHAQRDLFAQVHLDALVKAGHLAGAQNLLQPQLRAQPESRRLKRQAAKLYAALGLPSVGGDWPQAGAPPGIRRLEAARRRRTLVVDRLRRQVAQGRVSARSGCRSRRRARGCG